MFVGIWNFENYNQTLYSTVKLEHFKNDFSTNILLHFKLSLVIKRK